jgi:hypothetical protein
MNTKTILGTLAAAALLALVVFGGGSVPGVAPDQVRDVQGGPAAVDVPPSPLTGQAVKVRAVADVLDDVSDGLSGGAAYRPDQTDRAVDSLGVALTPFTGGLSVLAAVLFRSGRRLARESKRRGRVILEADANGNSPPIDIQVASGESMAEVRRVRVGEGQQ